MDAVVTAFVAFVTVKVYLGTFPEETGGIIPNCLVDAPIGRFMTQKKEPRRKSFLQSWRF